MKWWEERKNVFVREHVRLTKEWPDRKFDLRIKDGSLWLSGTIIVPWKVGSFAFEFELRYPRNYPYSIPLIYPKDRSKDWVAKHQFTSSAFCLDVRERSWNSSMSAVDIIKSLLKLLSAAAKMVEGESETLDVYEEPEPTKFDLVSKNVRAVVPVPFAVPQDARHGAFRFFVPGAGDNRVVVMPPYKLEEVLTWFETDYFKIWGLDFFSTKKGMWIVAADQTQLESLVFKTNPDSFKEFLIDEKLFDVDSYARFFQTDGDKYFLFLVSGNARLLAKVDKESVEFFGCYAQDLSLIYARHPSSSVLGNLATKGVTIVGCGSSGSYIAEGLVKSGIRRLTLVDEDYLSVENVPRHACNLTQVGRKKVHALKDHLRLINPKIEVECIDESVSVMPISVGEAIEKSQLVINATARIEEVINEYCWKFRVPSIHAKVYPLGFGGEVIRVIPHVTPCFECMNYELSSILTDLPGFNNFPAGEFSDYSRTKEGDEVPVLALDIDAKFISLVVAKMAIEILTGSDLAVFRDEPNIILWGNSKQWIFSQHLECIKVNTSTFQSFENCIVCFGENHIASELNMTADQIESVLSTIRISDGTDKV